MKFIITLTGALMAMADSIPGVSGGTIAFIMGIYDKMIDSIKNLAYKNSRKEAIKFLSKLLIGWVFGLVLAIFVITSLFESRVYELTSLFLGLIILSIPITLKQEKKILKNYWEFIFSIIGAGFVILTVNLSSSLSATSDVLVTSLAFTDYIYVFFVAMAAISCMLLPGVSGSTMLMICGVYFLIMNSIKSFLTFDFSVAPLLFVFGMGILFGGFFATKVISYLFKKYRSKVLYFILGLMIGSLYAIAMGPVSNDKAPLSLETFNIIWFLMGCIIILGLEQLRKLNERHSN